jgi:hypothetical protein
MEGNVWCGLHLYAKENVMPTLHIRKPGEAPTPSRSSRAVRELQQKYDDFVRGIDASQIGDLELEPSDNVRSVKVRLRRASSRLGINLNIWDVNGHVYFQHVARRGRPRKQA